MTNAASDIHPRRSTLTRLWSVSFATAAAFIAVGWWPAQNFGGDAGTFALIVATSIALLGSLAAAVPPAILCRGALREMAYAVLFGLGLRFFLTLGPALLLRVLAVSEYRPILIWIGVAQFVLLTADVAALAVVLKSARATEEAA